MGEGQIKQVTETKHLGIERNESNTPNTQERIKTTRKTLYSLLGAGLHGCNGISPIISFNMWTTYVTPRMLHGIEMLHIRKKDANDLEMYQRKTLKQIQGLPQNCATAAAYLLLGAIPVEGLIDMRHLSTFGNILQNPESLEFRLAKRQLLCKEQDSNSWFITMAEIMEKYNLAHPLDYLEKPPKKEKWKKEYKTQLKQYWHESLKKEAQEKSSLVYLSMENIKPGKPHPVWENAKRNPQESMKAAVKVKVMTGTYRLQTDRAKHSGGRISDKCKLCKQQKEDVKHFILDCENLQNQRSYYLQKIRTILQEGPNSSMIQHIFDNQRILLQMCIDCSHPEVATLIGADIQQIQMVTRALVYALHRERTALMAG
ncbi:hypothetical protein FSP39_018607 [Pinctada imbricata]|uniref:Reverse transcriptase zinc-binding domain-containing protein n=1 Tax=Pinctada imbricata TaxID=66713 RepID=A0AA89C3Z0_PINIB|nr:hypothetical protein FSP39_018607 [Pinctada imbricata]